MGSDLVKFLLARLDEDEKAARAVEPDPSLYPPDPIEFILAGQDLTGAATERAETHVRRHGPARVLADVEADRKLIAAYFDLAEKRRANAEKFTRLMRAPADNDEELPSTKTHGWELSGRMDGLLMALQIRVNRFAEHPGFDEEWRL